MECGTSNDLHFDHIDPTTKSHDVSAILLHGWGKISSELDKCQLLCRACHEAKTLAEREDELSEHGTLNRYRKYKCRCEPCRQAVAEYKNTWREERRAAGLPAT